MQSRPVKIGTRGSPLALWQANNVQVLLAQAFKPDSLEIEICTFRTSGDKIQDKSLREFGGKGLFTKEIEDALLAGDVHMAVHSMKDMPTVLPDGLEIACVLEREDVRDAFLSPKAKSLADLPQGARVGTSSLRRQAQVRKFRPDLEVVEFRGNVETRLRKLTEGVADATLLAVAGLNRLGKEGQITALVETHEMLPAVAQGAICIEVRSDDAETIKMLAAIHHVPTAQRVACERAFLAELDGSCRTPIAGLAELDGGSLRFRGQILTPDGREAFETAREGKPEDGPDMGRDAAKELLAKAGPNFFVDPD